MEIRIVKKVLAENDVSAAEVRARLRAKKMSMVNFMSSPGSGKTTLLMKLIPKLKDAGLRVGVIEGDIATTNDAERLLPLGIPIAQINTERFGGDCHLGAHVILGALDELSSAEMDVVLIENVGNLVCPAEFDTGADANAVLLSVTEGEDKPLKYPLMFRRSHAALINKIDIAQAVEADMGLMRDNILKINPHAAIFETSGKRGAGLDAVASWVTEIHRSHAR